MEKCNGKGTMFYALVMGKEQCSINPALNRSAIQTEFEVIL